MHIIAGLGNPGKNTTGRGTIQAVSSWSISERRMIFPGGVPTKKTRSLVSEGKIGKEKVMLVLPDGFMNNSGKSLAPLIKNKSGGTPDSDL